MSELGHEDDMAGISNVTNSVEMIAIPKLAGVFLHKIASNLLESSVKLFFGGFRAVYSMHADGFLLCIPCFNSTEHPISIGQVKNFGTPCDSQKTDKK